MGATTLLKKSGDYTKIGQLFQKFTNSTSLYRKCNLVWMSKQMQTKISEKFSKSLANIQQLLKKGKTACDANKNFAYFIQKEKNSLKGQLTCKDTDSKCQEISFDVKKSFEKFEHYSGF